MHNTESYAYDGSGQRVQKSGPGGTTTYVYDAFGNLAAEYGAAPSAPCTTCYLSYDHLGSVRLVTDQNANVVARHDYLPFGEEIPANTAGRNGQWGSTTDIDTKFTGQIRDTETGMDYFSARYYGSNDARFLTPDPLGGKLVNPQTLNKYVYVADNPLSYTDPTGLYLCADSKNCSSKQDKSLAKAIANDLKSKDPNVVRGANAYGKAGQDNGVTVKFGDPGKGLAGSATPGLRQDPNNPNKIQATETVTLSTGQSGSQLDATVGHEGSHTADAQAFAATINSNGGFNSTLNLTSYQTEMRAYMVTQSILASENVSLGLGSCGMGSCKLGAGVFPAQARQTIQQLLANPANGYGGGAGVTPTNQGPKLYPDLTTPH
ncbi:MAG: RHS repeat domain-containing protein [Bryobacteraceae bacterium]